MIFDSALLTAYKTLLQTTNLQQAYQEFIRFFRYLRIELEKQLPDCKFQGGIVENAMDYAYFSFTNELWKAHGLKIVVAFVHNTFQLEVWISGYNRKAQCHWAERLPASFPFITSADPAHTDYIVRVPVKADLAAGDAAVYAVKGAVERCMDFLAPYLTD